LDSRLTCLSSFASRWLAVSYLHVPNEIKSKKTFWFIRLQWLSCMWTLPVITVRIPISTWIHSPNAFIPETHPPLPALLFNLAWKPPCWLLKSDEVVMWESGIDLLSMPRAGVDKHAKMIRKWTNERMNE